MCVDACSERLRTDGDVRDRLDRQQRPMGVATDGVSVRPERITEKEKKGRRMEKSDKGLTPTSSPNASLTIDFASLAASFSDMLGPLCFFSLFEFFFFFKPFFLRWE